MKIGLLHSPFCVFCLPLGGRPSIFSSPLFACLLATSSSLTRSEAHLAMKSNSICALALMLVVLALAVSRTEAVIDASELAGLKAIRDAFPSLATDVVLRWTDARLEESCTVPAPLNPSGVTCALIGGVSHVVGLYAYYRNYWS